MKKSLKNVSNKKTHYNIAILYIIFVGTAALALLYLQSLFASVNGNY